MFITGKSSSHQTASRRAYTLIEMLAVTFIFAAAITVGGAVQAKYGKHMGALAGIGAALVAICLVILFYRWSWWHDEQQLTKLREQYRTIYRVKALPTHPESVVKPDGAEIRIGDYGWDARPSRRDGLVHLQGLTPRWQVVWHAGFLPDQIEKVTDKPASQYDQWRPEWVKKTPPPCPFPVQERSTPTMGLPYHSGHYFTNYPAHFYSSSGAGTGK
jgi:hypothetical protein